MSLADDGVLGHGEHPAMQEAVSGEIKGINLDLGFLTGVHKADVAITGGNAPALLDLVEKPLDEIARAIQVRTGSGSEA